MRVKYLGPHDEVQFPDTDPPIACLRGKTVDVPDDLGAELVAREAGAQWQAVVAPSRPSKPADKES